MLISSVCVCVYVSGNDINYIYSCGLWLKTFESHCSVANMCVGRNPLGRNHPWRLEAENFIVYLHYLYGKYWLSTSMVISTSYNVVITEVWGHAEYTEMDFSEWSVHAGTWAGLHMQRDACPQGAQRPGRHPARLAPGADVQAAVCPSPPTSQKVTAIQSPDTTHCFCLF